MMHKPNLRSRIGTESPADLKRPLAHLEQKKHIWQKQPCLISSPLNNIIGSYTISDVRAAVDSEFLEAGRGVVSDNIGGWNMASVSKVFCERENFVNQCI
jgi:hypothetical protein